MDLLEREVVLQALVGHLQAAVSGPGRLALLRGEAGIGRTTVVRHLAQLADPHIRVLVGSCDPLTTPRPLGPLMDLAPDLGQAVRTALAGVLAGSCRTDEVFDCLLADLRTCPSLLVVEDVHWADEATLDLLRYLVRRLPSVPALMVVTYRDDEIGRTHHVTGLLGTLAGYPWVYRHDLAPLSRRAVARLATGHAIDAEQLHHVSAGNPFIVTEVLAAPADPIPATVREAVAGRLAGLSAAARTVVDVLAVLGRRVSLQLLASILPAPEEALDEAVACGIVCTDGQRTEFRHELTRLAVLDAVPAASRLRVHRRVLEVMRSGPVAAQDLALLADHSEGAGDPTAVLEYAPAAAAHAASSGAYREAAAQYARALRYADRLPPDRLASLLEGHSRACLLSSRLDEGIATRRTAVRLRRELGDQLREGEDLRWLSCWLWPAGRGAEARQTGLDAVRVLEGMGPSQELAQAYLNLCQLACYGHERVEVTAAYAEKAIVVGERFGDAAVPVQARFHAAAARMLGEGCGWEDCEHALSSAMAQDLPVDSGLLALVTCWFAALRRDAARTTAAVSRAESYCLDRDLRSYLLCARAWGSWGLLNQGLWIPAADAAQAVLSHPGSPPVARSVALTVLGLVQARQGKARVWPLLERAASLADSDCLLDTGLGWEARVEAAWLVGDHELVRTEAGRGLAALADRTHPWLSGPLACWIQRAGGTPPQVPAAGPYALELAGDWAGAAAQWDRLGCPYDAALARLAGDTPALHQALTAFEALGARPAVVRTRALMRTRGVRPAQGGPRSATRANPYGLTNRELDVLKLLDEGLSDAEIAARLYITPKTAGHHVGAVLTKLGVHTRHEAARKLHPSEH
ncbi:LuxR family transcriptional regulator [Streptomyces sp. G-G2]|uniref:helix-turn-helix transcriptional regulator n=1 Tax=Streptomyces sp. G-G2 TaxID=3046201 RepID=UPI0024BBAB1C|nr:LuxR family transcriptional regulator [Streptomyces sp. G-G2]MDJ0382947.1 AAA family ATPase [Streptomyces sp. G-G2]